VTNIPIAADPGGNLWGGLTGRINMEDFSAAAGATLTSELATAGRSMVLYAEVDHGLEADEGTTTTLPFSGVVPSGSMVTGCIITCREAFDGGETVTIGRSGFTASILADANITKTLNAVSGEDPALYGSDLWVTGSQTVTAGDYSVTAWPAVTTPDAWALSALHVDSTSHNMDSHTQASQVAVIGSGTQTKTATNWAVGTYAHPKVKYCTVDTQYNAYRTQTETSAEAGTTGILDCYLFYTRMVG
jgi:hypothetical protein